MHYMLHLWSQAIKCNDRQFIAYKGRNIFLEGKQTSSDEENMKKIYPQQQNILNQKEWKIKTKQREQPQK